MLNGYKAVGVCVTKIQDEFCSEFLGALHQEALKEDYRLLVFNSFIDFFRGDKFEQGAKSIYKAINFEVLDVLVIVDHCFYDKQIVRELIEKAKNNNVPVVVMYGNYDGCFSVVKNYTNTYKELITHIIKVHNARKLCFIAGNKGEANSDLRLECFRQVMKENGLSIPEDGIAYCDYWDIPVQNAVDKWVRDGSLPDAIICANDSMACIVCDRLNHYGIKVPGDVLVTGFDGLESLIYRKPRLTTCAQNVSGTAELCFGLIRGAVENNAEPYSVEEEFSVILSESCGCRCEPDFNYRERADKLYRKLEDIRAQETKIYQWADSIYDSTDMSEIGRNLSKNILPDSAVAINSNLLFVARMDEEADPEHPFTEKMVIISSRDVNFVERGQEVYSLSEMYPRLDQCISENVMFVFQSIYAADETCGYYMAKICDIEDSAEKLHRLCRITNLDFSVILSHIKQENMVTSIEKIRIRDSLTGLMNLKGLVTLINENYEEYSKNSIVVSVYAIPRYKYIIENFGLEDAEEAVSMTSEALQLANPINALISRISEDEFIIVNLIEDPELIGETIDHATSAFFRIIEEYNRSRDKDYFVEVNCGCVVSMPGWEKDIMSFIKAANGEMYLNRLKNGNTPALKQDKSMEEYYRLFDLLIEKNLFVYHFQPIVSAKTGEVYAYEALMRTDSIINLSPVQILGVADEYNRLYDIERATLFNVMGYINSHRGDFEGRRVFINTIPGCFLKDDDHKMLVEKFGHLFSCCTIEITEQNETNDAELMQIRRLESSGDTCQLAIDDYGTGFSNIVNLLRYQPQVIKIDRYLITDVHKDTNKQLFISSTVEFAKLNNILVLAEGVETKEELSKVIELGVDLIQGYYTGRPSAAVLKEIDSDIADFIKAENARLFQSGNGVYKANDGEILNLSRIVESGCSSVEFYGGRYIVYGTDGQTAAIKFVTAPDSLNYITFEDVNISVTDSPAVVLGGNSKNFFTMHGDNFFGGTQLGNEGIRVPSGAELTLNGEGSLSVLTAAVSGVTLGGRIDEDYGCITVDMDGILTVTATGDNAVGIGGGHNLENEFINIVKGTVIVDVRGVHSIGIGSASEGSLVIIGKEADVSLLVIGNEGVAVGSMSGNTDIMFDGNLKMRLEGEKIVGIGILDNGSGRISLNSGNVSSDMRGANAVTIGSMDGSTDILCAADTVNIYVEGGKACGMGNYDGAGSVTVKGGIICEALRSSGPVYVGSEGDRTVIDGGNIIIENGTVKNAVNSSGEPLEMREITDCGVFEAQIVTEKGSYIYKAEKNADKDKLCVYLPAACEIRKAVTD